MKPFYRLVARSRQRLRALLPETPSGPDIGKAPRWTWLTPTRLMALSGLASLRPRPRPFFTELHALLDRKAALTLGDLVDAAQEQTYGLLILILALPSLIPGLNLGAAPVGGLFLVWIGLQMALGRPSPRLPLRLRRQPLHQGRVKEGLAKLEGYLERLGSKTHLRHTLNHRWMGVAVTLTALLLAIPVPLPFGNLLPASILVLLGAALVEERPAWGWVGASAALANAIYFGASFHLVVHTCLRALATLRNGIT